jgi:hypothetical protein
VLGEFSSE